MEDVKLTSMTVAAVFEGGLNLEDLFENLCINNKILGLRFNKKTPINDCDGLSENEIYLLSGLNGICKNRDTLEIQMRGKSVKLTKYRALITGCRSLNEAKETLDELNLPYSEIQEELVNYLYPINVHYLLLIRHFSGLHDFFIEQKKETCILKYKKTVFNIRNDKVRQSSQNTQEAQEAYNRLISELGNI
jgi:hypothetical protein